MRGQWVVTVERQAYPVSILLQVAAGWVETGRADLGWALGIGWERKGQTPPSLRASQWQQHQALVPPQVPLTSGTMGTAVLVLP